MTPDDPIKPPPPELDAAVDAAFAYGRHKRVLERERMKFSHPTLTPTGKRKKASRKPRGSKREC